ncbi:HD domain-containing protein [Methanobrevibacter sp. DSM 116169]|uniref:HD domain-containing protein n=1 Tax=Methanobrevibacter sp. DSM 116169 TaxID=3242727 RepID=UPI0038FC5F1A
MNNNYHFIRDSVHGNLKVTDFEMHIIDTKEFQRLRRIKQLGLINLIYPGANHTRFEHSIGTMHLSSKLANQLELSEYDSELVRISALLHDIGHGPFSHVSEGVLEFPHEQLTEKVIKTSAIKDKLSERFNINDIADIINGKGKYGPIVSGELDVDRMDYLIRDSHYTGVSYGVIDTERIISNLKLEKYLVLDIKGVQAAEATLVSRYFMYPSVYQHHTTRIVNAMFRRILRMGIDEDIIKANEIYKFDDADLTSIFRNSDGFIKDIMTKIDNRELFKRVHTTKLNDFKNPEQFYNISKEELRKAEERISIAYGIEKEYVILNIAEYPKFDEMKTQVSTNGKLYHLNDISSIVKGLSEARFNMPDISLYVPKEYRSKMKKFKLEEYIDLPEKSENEINRIHYDQIKLF